MTSTNGIIGDQDSMLESPTQLPQPQIDDSQLKELQRTAKFARSNEYKELKAHYQARIDFYQKYLPDGRPVATAGAQAGNGIENMSLEELGKMWLAANVIISEFNSIMNIYEQAAQYVKDAATQR